MKQLFSAISTVFLCVNPNGANPEGITDPMQPRHARLSSPMSRRSASRLHCLFPEYSSNQATNRAPKDIMIVI
jgi:hypothetical protein